FMQAGWADPKKPVQPLEQVREFAQQGVEAGLMSEDDYRSFMKDYYTKSEKKYSGIRVAAAFANGDMQELLRAGKTAEEGLNAWVEMSAQTQTSPEVVTGLLKIGTGKGMLGAFKKVGELAGPAFNQLGNGKEMDAGSAATAKHILSAVE